MNYTKYIADRFLRIEETFQILPSMKRFYKVGLLTNMYPGVLEIVIESNFFNIEFDEIVNSSKYKVAKPDEAIYSIATEKTGCGKKQIFFVDDSVENIEAAKNYGWQTFLLDLNNPKDSVDNIKTYLGI
ncbi:HAD-IA family hydrolase [Patescibacteria group bacterium]|nr:HAD-IA family hydrolase [Patescibacteria group bacterium]